MYRYTAIAILLFTQLVLAQNNSDQVVVFPNKTYRGSFKPVNQATETIKVIPDAIKNNFVIKMKNADGKNHENVVCTGGILQKCSCGLRNLANLLYRELFRVEYAEIIWNGKKVVDASTFNKNVAILSVSVKPELNNSLVIKYKGFFTSFFSLGIYRPSSPKDTTAPTILTQLRSNTFTNQKSVSVEIQDISNVTSTVSINGAVIKSSTAKSFTFDLANGNNNIEIKSQDQFNNTASPVLISNVVLDQSNPNVSLSSNAPIYVNSLPKTLAVQLISNEPLKSLLVNSNQVSLDESGQISFYNLNVLQPGANGVAIQATDLAGNVSNLNLSLSVILDNIAPVISFGITEGTLANQSLIVVPVKITEANDVHSIIKVNGIDVLRTGAKDFDFEASLLLEGENQIQIESTDIAGNVSQSATLKIVRDMTPAVLSNINPQNNRRIDRLSFGVSGISNEPLKKVSVNGLSLKLEPDAKSFSGVYLAAQNGNEVLNFEAEDLAGNVSNLSTNVTIDNRLVIPELISISPNPDREHLNIVGAAGSVRSNINISASAGLLGFNSDSGTSNPDGSFILKLSPFSVASLKVTDSQNNEEVTVQLSYQLITRLSGVVKDTQGNPLPGATVQISSFNGSALTDSSGVFNISSPATGDQVLTIDGSSIPQSVTGAARKFSTTRIQINIGLGQENVLERPIFLAPLYLDGTETNIAKNQAATVTSPAAPGVSLSIPANSAVFPSGSAEGKINIATIESDKATVPAPPNMLPKNVVALEPSGLKFEERVPVTLPNEYDLPAGVEMFILSMDSTKGTWSVDSTAIVSSDGQTIKTKEGDGISHFSLIYAIPAKPVFAAVDKPKMGGVDISQGSLSTSISLPSWKSLGVSISPNLVYKSNWANPTAYVSNYIDVPKQEFTISKESSAAVSQIRAIKGRYCDKFLGVTIRCYNTYDEYVLAMEAKDTLEQTSWYQPESIRSQFFVGSLTSGPIQFVDNTTQDYNQPGADISVIIPGPIFSGGFGSGIVNYTGIPNRSMISYAVPLKNNATGEYLPSGIYPSLTRFELKIKNLTLRSTTSYRASSITFFDSKFSQFNQSNVTFTSETTKTSTVLDQVFPSDIVAPLLVQNKVKSSIGRGWHLGLTQTILSPNSNKILLEEESGDLSTYAINNTITTIFNSTNTGVDTDFAFDYSRWPKVVGVSKDSAKDNYLVEVDLSLPNPTPVRLVKIPQLEGGIPVNAFESGECNENESFEVANRFYTYKTQTHLSGLVRNSNGEYYGLTSLGNSLFSLKNGIFSNLYLSSRPTNSIVQNFNRLSESQIENECLRYSGETCTKYTLSSYNCFIDCPSGSCPGLYPKDLSYGALGIYGGISDLYGSHNGFEMPLNEAGFNKASSLTTSPDGYLIVADTGNNMVRKIDVVNNLVHTIAGDGSNLDMADGVPATEAKIFHPKSVAYDNDGNLYILTQNGYIRKVNSTGMISHFGGVPPAQGGAQFEAPFKQMPLYQPSSMVFDKVNQYLYVADTGNHRVVRFDLNTEIASTVAGTGACDIGQVADNTAALNSSLCSPKNIGLDSQQNLIVVDSGHNRIRKVNFNYANTGTLAFTPTSKDGSVLYRYNDNSWSRVLRNGTTIYFNTIGAQTKTRDRLGNQVVYSYNSEGKLEKVTDAVGQVTSLNYSGSLLSSIVDPAGRTTGFSYSFGNLTSITFPDGSSKSYEYDGNGLMKKEINQRGFSKKYTYNEFSRLATVTDEFDKSVQINDVVSGSMSNSYTGENAGTLNNQGASQTQLHDRVVDAKEVSTEITKDFNGLVLKLKDGKGQITSIERDLEGYTKKVIFPDSSEVTLEYDELTKDLLKTTDTGTGITESQTFNRFGQLISKTDPKGFTYVKEYDPTTGLLVKETAPNLQNLIYTYNSSGLLASVTKTPASGISITTNIEYDSLGNRSKMILPDGKSVSYAYDGSGNLIQKTMQISSNSQEITKYQFDVLNRLRKVTSPKNEITEYNYLPTGQLSNIKDPLNNETIFEYNQKGLLTKKIEPDNKTYTFSYDFNGNLVSETDPNGITKVYSIDELNQISKITLPDDEYNFVYSAKGEVIVVSNNAASITQSYDTKSRVVASVVQASSSLGSYPVVPLSYSYDKNGNRETLRSTALNLDYVYDQSNRLRQITNSNGDYFNFYIDNANRITKISRPGSETNFSYNAGDLLSSIVHSNSNGVVDSNGYSFDQRNLTTQKRTIAGNFDYSYDSSGQLTSANSPELGENFTCLTKQRP
ncbi:MAG: carboxypeptidase regulatory-like domain-containing protein [Bdellovibrionaceae bacterium]|nr:carboxypeptidase regulatory-like domain-containing protein [Pseudobdellovibrionaceae bacterium]